MSENKTKKELAEASKESLLEPLVESKEDSTAEPKGDANLKGRDNVIQDNAKSNRNGSGLVYVLLILLLVLSGGAIYLWNKSTQQQQVLDGLLTVQQDQNVEQFEQYKNLEEQLLLLKNNKTGDLDILTKKVAELGSQTVSLQSQLNLTQQKLDKEKGGVDADLFLNEADFLIRTAAIRLLLTENATSSISLLQAADQRLLRISDVAVIPVREAIAEDIYKLKASEQRDVSGSYLKLEVIGEALSKLTINYILPEQQQQKETNDSNQDWKEHLAESSEQVLTKWFQITHYNEPVKPLLSPDQRSAIKQGIALMIKQAQWALIQKDNNLYQNVLSRLQKEIINNFEKKDKNTEIAQQQIKELLGDSMVAPLPQILEAEKSIKEYLSADKSIGDKE